AQFTTPVRRSTGEMKQRSWRRSDLRIRAAGDLATLVSAIREVGNLTRSVRHGGPFVRKFSKMSARDPRLLLPACNRLVQVLKPLGDIPVEVACEVDSGSGGQDVTCP